MADKQLTVDDKLSIAHIKLDTLEKENEQLLTSIDDVVVDLQKKSDNLTQDIKSVKEN